MDISRNIVRKLRENRLLNERSDYKSMSRDELITKAQEGDQLAIETLVNTHQDMIINYTKKYNLDTGDFDDIKQYVTIAFWEAVKSWNHTGNFEAYAGMIIKRKMTDVLRSEDTGKAKINTQADYLDAPAGTDEEGGEMTLGATLPSKSLSPEDEYIERSSKEDTHNKLMKFIEDNLSDTERKVIRLYLQEYKTKEIAEVLEMKYKTVDNTLTRVKNKLADYFRGMKESRHLRVHEAVFTDEEKQMLLNVLDELEESKKMNESAEDSVYMRDIIDTWNMIEKYNIPYTQDNKGIKISREDYNRLLNSVKNPKYIRNLVRNR